MARVAKPTGPPDPKVRQEALAIHLILALTPGTMVEQVRQDVKEEAIRLAKLDQRGRRRT